MSDDRMINELEGAAEPTTDGPEGVAEAEILEATEVESGTARLVVKRSGAETTDVFEVHAPAVIGRFDAAVGPVDVDLGPLPEGVYVSRKHARLGFADGIWTIEDLGSSNGTFILRDSEFQRVETAELADGDEIALGNARFVFHI